MLAPYGSVRSSEGGAQAPRAPPLDMPLYKYIIAIVVNTSTIHCLTACSRRVVKA